MKTLKFRWNATKAKLACRAYFQSTPELWESYCDDKIAQREFWLNFTDELCRDRLISQHDRDNWSCPF